MPYTCTTLTPANVDSYLANYDAFRQRNLSACPVFGEGTALRVPSGFKVRHFVNDPENAGFFAVAISNLPETRLFGIALLQDLGNGVAKLCHFTLDDVQGAPGVVNATLDGARHLKTMGFEWVMGGPTGEFRNRMLTIANIEERSAYTWLNLRALQ